MQGTTLDRQLLTSTERAELAVLSQEVSYPAGTILVRENEDSDFVLYIDEGLVKAVVGNPSTTVAIHDAGAVIGELAALTGRPRSANLVALTEVRALFVPGQVWRLFIEEHPRAMMAHLVGLAERHRKKDLAEESTLTSERKLARLLVQLVDKGLCRKEGDDLVIDQLIQRDLGSLANISRESVSATLKRLRDKDAVTTTRGRLTIHDLVAVRAIADREIRSG